MTGTIAAGWPMTFPDVMLGNASALTVFNNLMVTVELLAAQLLFALRAPHPGRARVRAAQAVAVMLAVCALLVQIDAAVASPTLRMGVRYGVLFACSCLAVRYVIGGAGRVAVVCCVCGYAMQHIAAAVMKIVDLLRAQAAIAWSTPMLGSWIVGIVLRGAVFASIYLAFLHRFIRRLDMTAVWTGSRTTLALLTGAVLAVTVALSSYASAPSLGLHTGLVLRAVSVLTCLIILLLFGELSRNHRLTDEIAFMKRMDAMRADHYAQLRDVIEETNVRCHDMKHQIAAMRASGGAADGAFREELDDLARTADLYDGVARTGCAPLDVVLTQKSRVCAARGIRFTYMADASCLEPMRERDVYALFGNALDNAIEAVTRLADPERRIVKMTVARRAGFVSIIVANYFDHVERDAAGDIVSSRPDPRGHGYGLKSMRRIAGEYGGTMSVDTDGGTFTVSILLPDSPSDATAPATG
ncbi:ATP-binding protein [Bifidobacterium samirii]|uniref:Signal transduction histidine kinase regulating citrate/malate metabolism n=1 Tax=Bifidobacterium samirii TaxID=2306974 RepID=A0A430FUY9_9BIFI|nr:ATP-binding protein [Bifidobacterium samirii]RSX57203.1 signal transduction histidine kinase regulating citrate/malate metabolism [Bifidobacterium samirii]